MEKNKIIDKEGKYEIVSFKLKDGTEVKTDKDTHVMILNDRRIENSYEFKISYIVKDDNDLRILSNKCNMLAHVFKYMREDNLTFEEGVAKYDNLIETKIRRMKHE